jgi:hypothetical protein
MPKSPMSSMLDMYSRTKKNMYYSCVCYLGMKTEQKYSELTVFVFYIINRFLT